MQPASSFAASSHTTRLTAVGGKADDDFGYAGVAVAGDIAVVAAIERAVAGHTQQGMAYVFRRPDSGWAHAKQVAVLSASDGGAEDNFGLGVATDGSTIVVAAPGHTIGSQGFAGAVYVFSKPAGGWSGSLHQSAELRPSAPVAEGEWGYRSVAVAGRTVVVGDPAAAVAGHTGQGEALVYTEPQHGWSKVITRPTATLTATDGAAQDALGYSSIAVSGSTIVAGAGGHDVGLNADQGASYVFTRPAAGWSGVRHESAELTATDGAAEDQLGGFATAISGRTVVASSGFHEVGTNAQQGEAYVFTEPASGWSGARHESARLLASDGTAGDYLGLGPIVISGDIVATASPYHVVNGVHDAGTVYLYQKPSRGWSGTRLESAERVATGPQSGDSLGYGDLAISGTTLIAGTDGHDVGANAGQGAAYVFSPARPALSRLATSTHSFAARSRATVVDPAHPHKGGLRLSFTLQGQQATVSLAIARRGHGHHAAVGTVTVSAPQGRDRVYFFGRLSARRVLRPGSYTIAVFASSASGVSKHHVEHVTVVRS
jgi:hypothetical protein